MIYFDHAATSFPKPRCVIDAVADAMLHMGNPGRGAHEVSLDASRMIYDARDRLARLFGAESPEQVVFTANSTESLNIAIQGLFEDVYKRQRRRRGGFIRSSSLSWASLHVRWGPLIPMNWW